jgi:hypothetical protein
MIKSLYGFVIFLICLSCTKKKTESEIAPPPPGRLIYCDGSSNRRIDSLRNYIFESSTAPNYIYFRVKSKPTDYGQEICIFSNTLHSILSECKIPLKNVYFGYHDRPFIITNDTCFIKNIGLVDYDIKLVDSINRFVYSQIKDSVKCELIKSKHSATFYKYYKNYRIYLIHSFVKDGAYIFKDCESGYPMIRKY